MCPPFSTATICPVYTKAYCHQAGWWPCQPALVANSLVLLLQLLPRRAYL